MTRQFINIIFLLTFSFGQTLAQKDSSVVNSKDKEHFNWPDIALSPGVVFQRQTFGEINLLVGRYSSETGGNGFGGVRFGIESNLKENGRQIYAPKIGLEISGMLFCMRVTLLNYITNTAHQTRLLPEIGISFFGFANLTYGYNLKLSNNYIDGISNHRLCLSININRDVIEDAFSF